MQDKLIADERKKIMKQLKRDLKTVARDLKKLTQKTDRLLKQFEKIDKPTAAKNPKTAARKKSVARKAKKMSPSDAVLSIIKRRKKGTDVATLKKMTGFKDNNLRAIIFRLRKKGDIKSDRKGIYVKA
jgi:septal ring factor EnvC (AmiA/AmiB activator)